MLLQVENGSQVILSSIEIKNSTYETIFHITSNNTQFENIRVENMLISEIGYFQSLETLLLDHITFKNLNIQNSSDLINIMNSPVTNITNIKINEMNTVGSNKYSFLSMNNEIGKLHITNSSIINLEGCNIIFQCYGAFHGSHMDFLNIKSVNVFQSFSDFIIEDISVVNNDTFSTISKIIYMRGLGEHRISRMLLKDLLVEDAIYVYLTSIFIENCDFIDLQCSRLINFKADTNCFVNLTNCNFISITMETPNSDTTKGLLVAKPYEDSGTVSISNSTFSSCSCTYSIPLNL